MTTIDTAIIPVAGLGTRMLPATKEQPKEMLPVPIHDPRHGLVFKPFLQLIFEQLFDTGIRRFIFVVGRGKRIIEDHFTPDWSYTEYLRNRGKEREASLLEDFYKKVEASIITWVNQPHPLGFGDAVQRAAQLAQGPFIVHAGDIAILGSPNPLAMLIQTYQELQPDALILVREVENPSHYGVVVAAEPKPTPDNIIRVKRVIEKPAKPPSKLAITAVYVFTPSILKALEKTPLGPRGEKELTDAIQKLIDSKADVRALVLDSDKYKFIDIGRPDAYIDAIGFLAGKRSLIPR